MDLPDGTGARAVHAQRRSGAGMRPGRVSKAGCRPVERTEGAVRDSPRAGSGSGGEPCTRPSRRCSSRACLRVIGCGLGSHSRRHTDVIPRKRIAPDEPGPARVQPVRTAVRRAVEIPLLVLGRSAGADCGRDTYVVVRHGLAPDETLSARVGPIGKRAVDRERGAHQHSVIGVPSRHDVIDGRALLAPSGIPGDDVRSIRAARPPFAGLSGSVGGPQSPLPCRK